MERAHSSISVEKIETRYDLKAWYRIASSITTLMGIVCKCSAVIWSVVVVEGVVMLRGCGGVERV